MSRVVFLIDGFNMYHSLVDAHNTLGIYAKWLDLHSLCRSYIPLFGKDAVLEEVHYFSAFAHHKNDASVIKRHEAYKNCLEDAGVITHMGRFKARTTQCPLSGKIDDGDPAIQCPLGGHFTRHDEKETDVAIAVKLCELVHKKRAEIIVLVTGDTDLTPAVRLCNEDSPKTTVLFAFPYKRSNAELKRLAPKSFEISIDAYKRHQFHNPMILSDGRQINKPSSW